jgi:hypothetical protein
MSKVIIANAAPPAKSAILKRTPGRSTGWRSMGILLVSDLGFKTRAPSNEAASVPGVAADVFVPRCYPGV